jgi:hypothetical protein
MLATVFHAMCVIRPHARVTCFSRTPLSYGAGIDPNLSDPRDPNQPMRIGVKKCSICKTQVQRLPPPELSAYTANMQNR